MKNLEFKLIMQGIVKSEIILLLIMLPINKKIEDKSLNIPSRQLLNQVPAISNPSKHRNTFTAKVRPRTFLSSGKGSRLELKGASIRQEQQGKNMQNEYRPQHQQIQGVIHRFDNLQLEDFLKIVIVGKTKFSETKSKQIIRSLNGTWFKNTDSNSPVNRLYCSLPIRKQKNMAASRINEEEKMKNWTLSGHFYKNYTPPNLFPKRKISPTKHRFTQIQLEKQNTNKLDFGYEIKHKIAQKPTSFRQQSHQSKRKRRPSSYFSNNRQTPSFKNFDQEQYSCLLGKKMVIHD